jgi:hypothetical protein
MKYYFISFFTSTDEEEKFPYQVGCECGSRGPSQMDDRLAIKSWNKREVSNEV